MSKQWYVVHTYSGYEHKVKESLEERIKILGLQDEIFQILVPTEEVIELKKGKRKISPRKFFPGYILVEMEMTSETWNVVRSIPKITGFVGGGTNPPALSEKEIKVILEQISSGKAKPKPKILFDVGENVRVIDGPFTNFTGIVENVNPDRGKIKVMVSIFGRSTPLELDFAQVEKI